MKTRDARQLSQDAQEELRRRAVAMVRGGMTRRDVAELLDVHRETVGDWVRRAAEEGDAALAKRKRGNPTGPVLSGTRAAQVCNIIREKCPDQLKFPFALWTREAVQHLIRKRFGLDLATTTVGKYLRQWGFTPQKPLVRAYERNPESVRRWMEEEYPAIRARARAESATIWWGDETGLRSRHQAGTTYGLKGQTPVVKGTAKYFGCNVISAITNRGHLAFQVYDGSFNAEVFQAFLSRLVRESSQKVFLVVDNLRVHRAKVLQPWLEANAARIELFFLPAYAPDLNPDELLNGDLKRHTGGRKRARTVTQLKANTIAHLKARQASPETVAAFFRERHVAYAAAA